MECAVRVTAEDVLSLLRVISASSAHSLTTDTLQKLL